MVGFKSSEIVQSLRARIAAGEWRATQQLPNERDLATHYDVARNTVRRAIAELSDEGIVVRHVGRGTLIRESVAQQEGDLADIVRRLNEISPYDIMNMRLIIEPQAAAAAAINASDQQLVELDAIHAQAIDAIEMAAFERLDMAFHDKLFLAAHNEFLRNLNTIMVIMRRNPAVLAIRKSAFTEARRVECNAQHADILAALHARSPSMAAEAMKLHLSVRSRNLFGGNGLQEVGAI